MSDQNPSFKGIVKENLERYETEIDRRGYADSDRSSEVFEIQVLNTIDFQSLEISQMKVLKEKSRTQT